MQKFEYHLKVKKTRQDYVKNSSIKSKIIGINAEVCPFMLWYEYNIVY